MTEIPPCPPPKEPGLPDRFWPSRGKKRDPKLNKVLDRDTKRD
jgi:hypothetical protein